MVRVSEVVTIDKVKSWKDGDIITITAGTGAGKSYFIKNILYAHAKKNNKKILMLIHRKDCVDQFTLEIEKDKKTDTIDIITYQKIEHLYINNQLFDFSDYQYIVCDEFHYFMSDAAFNKTTDISLTQILEQDSKIRIFMSATGDYVQKYIRDYKKYETIDYVIPIQFNFIKELTFFNKDSTMEKFIEEAIEKKNKAIFFIQSAKKAYELHKKYPEYTMFNCSRNNNEYRQFVNEEKVQQMLINQKFDDLILITTTCMDTGVNIRDKELKHIVCDVKDVRVLKQCIGRKRLEDKTDKIYLYIKTVTNQQLGGRETQLSKKLEMARFLRNNTVQAYIEKHKRKHDRYDIVYDDIVDEENKGTKKVNELMYFKYLTDITEIQMMKKYGKFGYCKFLAHEFGYWDQFDGYLYRLIKEDNKEQELEEYLDSIVGKKLFKNEQKELIEKIDLRVNGRRQRSITKLNEGLKMIKANYRIIKNVDYRRKLEDGSENSNRNKTYWEVVRSLA